LKRKKQQSPPSRPPARADAPASAPPPASPDPRRRWFRLAALALPLVLLGVFEAGLRLFGYGYPTPFFLKREARGQPVFIENQEFTKRFFPPGLARTPEPVVVPAKKGPDTCRIFIFGESAAMGDPAPAFGFGRILEVLLRAQYPGKQFEVVNVAVTAINSHVVREIARDCAAREGDVWLIYLGNNEVIGPFGAATVFSAQAPRRALIRATLAFRATRTGQWLEAVRFKLTGGKGAPASWEGLEMFLNQQLREEDPRLTAVYDHFARNLDDLLRLAARARAQVLLSTVVSNLKDCPPFASLHRADLSAAALADWTKLWQTATNHEAAQQFPAALAAYQAAARLDDRFAELHFRVGRCHWALGQHAEARRSFERARDLDTLRFRADTRINDILRRAAQQRADGGVRLVDAVETFARHSPHGVPGEELLYEHVHPNFDGQYLLARTFAEAIAPLLPPRIAAAATRAPLLTSEECARRLACTDWDRYQVVDEVFKRLQLPPFTSQLDHAARSERLNKWRSALEPALRPEGVDRALAIYRQALALAPEDWVLHANFARLLQESAELRGAEEHWRRVIELVPHNCEPYYHLANVLDARGNAGDAVTFFRQALQRQPDMVEARNGLGLAFASMGRVAEAVAEYEAALRRKPDFAEARVNLGQLLASQGKADAAVAQYTAALRANSNSAAAHINLGKMLAGSNRLDEAIAHYEAALRVSPNNFIAHYNLGNALHAQGRPAALTHYAEAARLKPDFAEARYNLAVGLANRGRTAEAISNLTEVVRMRPEMADAQFNLGVALARERRFDEAIARFEETLRLEPNNEQARRFLEQATALRGK
jgi:tetratricopeptide (TPR) repeat protein